MAYGEHQEIVSEALLALMHPRTDPETEPEEILQVRRQAQVATRERLYELGLSRHQQPRGRLNRSMAAAHHPLHVLAGVLGTLPAVEPGAQTPSELLTQHSGDGETPALVLWRTVARHLTLGNHDLRASADQTWRNPKAEWYLIGDLAITIEAFVLLEQLSSRSANTRRDSATALENRLAAGTVARVASWRATDTSPDLAFAAPESTLGALGGPRIHLVRRPEDFVLAQQTLAGFLRPRLYDLDDLARLDRPGLLAARTVAPGQIRLAKAFANWAERAGEQDLAERFLARIPLYTDLHRSTLRLTEVQRTTSPLIVAQQSESIQQLRRHHDARLDIASMHALDRASCDVVVNTGKSLRREVLARGNILAISNEDLSRAEEGKLGSPQRFATACRALVQQPQMRPDQPVAIRHYRQVLADSLTHPMQ